ncbi:hypothetical protein REBECCA_88 [Erwinia phage Rebecca]|uniref:Uncharacterized protein n=1 Tax=Erwinia phage Rebecca TaxID=2530026 RepID=A0A482ICU2_9CAUD|nr:hypothetical protein REBECCA_88 [Erwinia phage Rebecca]
MKRGYPSGQPIEVEVGGAMYQFNPLENMLADLRANKLIIVCCSNKKRAITDIWMCDSEIDYSTQARMEHILVSDRCKQFTKDYALTRVVDVDSRSLTIAGPDKKMLSMVIMGDTLYAVKPS